MCAEEISEMYTGITTQENAFADPARNVKTQMSSKFSAQASRIQAPRKGIAPMRRVRLRPNLQYKRSQQAIETIPLPYYLSIIHAAGIGANVNPSFKNHTIQVPCSKVIVNDPPGAWSLTRLGDAQAKAIAAAKLKIFAVKPK